MSTSTEVNNMTSTALIIPMPHVDSQISIIRITDNWYRGTASDRGHRLTFFGASPQLVKRKYRAYESGRRDPRSPVQQYLAVQRISAARKALRFSPGMRVHVRRRVGVFLIAATAETNGHRIAWLNGVRGAVPVADLIPADELETLA